MVGAARLSLASVGRIGAHVLHIVVDLSQLLVDFLVLGTLKVMLHDSVFLLVRPVVAVPFSLVLVLGSTSDSLELTADVARVGVENKVRDTS